MEPLPEPDSVLGDAVTVIDKLPGGYVTPVVWLFCYAISLYILPAFILQDHLYKLVQIRLAT
jgi:hypothetical protein